MKTIEQIKAMDYYELLDHITSIYRQRHGSKKIRNIADKLLTSDKIAGLINRSRYLGIPPAATDFIYCIHEIPYFLFSTSQTKIALASLLALERWNIEVNSQQYLLSEDGLRLMAKEILQKLLKGIPM
jgi:hypothetical protein